MRFLKFTKNTIFKKKLIFIIGTGRSGTHLLGRTFGNSNEIDAYIEDKRFFGPITELAVGLNKNKHDFNKILKKYKRQFSKSNKKYILEKTHPNIWFVEEILNFFPNAKFIGIKRNVYATVSSMLNHQGVLSWYNKLPLNKINIFLGITEENKEKFKNLPIESKCALRWMSHDNRLNYLEKNYSQNVLILDYDDFYNEYPVLMLKLKNFLNLDFDLVSESLKPSNKDKWKLSLTENQKKNIDDVLNN